MSGEMVTMEYPRSVADRMAAGSKLLQAVWPECPECGGPVQIEQAGEFTVTFPPCDHCGNTGKDPNVSPEQVAERVLEALREYGVRRQDDKELEGLSIPDHVRGSG